MTDRTFASLASRIEPIIKGAPRPLVVDHVRQAARAICTKSLIWRYQVPVHNLLPGVHEYPFNAPTGTEVVHLFAAHVNNCPLDKLTLHQALVRYPAWADLYSGEDAEELWSETPGGYLNATAYNEDVFNAGSTFVLPDSIVADASTPLVITSLSPQRYIVLPLPDGETYEMRMFIALKPTLTATGMDDQVFNRAEDAILYHALSTMLLMKSSEWYDPQLAGVYNKLAKDERLENKAEANIGVMGASMHVRMPRWA